MSESKIRVEQRELSSKGFNYTPNGLIVTNDIKSVYSVFVICMELKDLSSEPKNFFGSFNKTYPYSFSLDDAIQEMKDFKLSSKANSTHVTISYQMNGKLARHLLDIFMSAKLLHCPADRTRSAPKEKVLLQPTPKGTAILQKFSRDVGLKILPPILSSNINSMELFTFERSSVSDSIIHSDYLIHILFIKLMGTQPNVWSPSNPSDTLPSLSELLECGNDTFTFENMNVTAIPNINGNYDETSSDIPTGSWSDQIPEDKLISKIRNSPFSHKFFTNPDSDSHIQYYVSNSGIRLFKSKKFGDNNIVIDYTFTTKAIWQWLVDCTDITYPQEAIAVAALFLKVGLIVPILLPPSETSRRKFSISRSSYFTLSKLGSDIVQWSYTNKDVINSPYKNLKIETPKEVFIDTGFIASGNVVIPDDKKVLSNNIIDLSTNEFFGQYPKLHMILRDPGMRYLFRLHLEKEFCVENLDSYIDIKKFLKKMSALRKIMETRNNNDAQGKNRYQSSKSDIISTINSALIKQANECLEMAYRIYSSYIMVGAPYQLNIDHILREDISTVMLHPKSPISETFESPISSHANISIDHTKPKLNIKLEAISPPEAIFLPRDSYIFGKNPGLSRKSLRPTPLNIGTELQSIDTVTIDKPDSADKKYILKYSNNIPVRANLQNTIKILKKLYPLLEDVSMRMYRLMNIDSLQKFQNSDLYREIITLIENHSN
ncbi:similar to Saccharomyces cerevisiae YLR452C SST2 GTPase-activating protein for Gpa1p, regulates desensitization to alpha factor pheromone [Maudiozyma barnettii]|uniref:Similar to Saccharomyces cerevisiae YLR452C SST2 GTPase-activating protein for Gpa1p, regulates desensitization to alpha factor pheromone n=1 Tax=Maudiozyma barnettii TaxID=61262 RepID=A0A8H2VHE4_9SACH|nr:GTPase-activating protein SST2 [Kazachstania barnettii]CAB4255605.1 similar to Saccharomyces cerevisiae YLR452C SST2 GTPase-activating protein for Gpa1p, regulates desensitization to alpha factor pheromone [Kazachstania barnettii]CAD1784166.1 similar to Saccharomyces cerevisiae YLR452C SST2 GTPase-activating protein for Gpa1p, regulates desensitization to alpha factor pheromone [Kazachstania barnettii]